MSDANQVPYTDEETALLNEHTALCHAMQSGVAMEMNYPERASATEPKHLRVGVNVAMTDHAALVALLIAKGLITRLEYLTAIRDMMKLEVKRYEASISARNGTNITLG